MSILKPLLWQLIKLFPPLLIALCVIIECLFRVSKLVNSFIINAVKKKHSWTTIREEIFKLFGRKLHVHFEPSQVNWVFSSLRHDTENVIKLAVMSLTYTGPDRKKIKLASSHVSHLLIKYKLTEKFDRASPTKPCRKSRHNCFRFISFRFCVFNLSCIFTSVLFSLHACTIFILGWADFVAFRMQEGKLDKTCSLVRTFCLKKYFMNKFSARQ